MNSELPSSLTADEKSQLEEYINLLAKHGRNTNLVSSLLRPDLIAHINDSLLLQSALKEDPLSIMDLGSGGGFPVIPLAIVASELQFTAVDSTLRKCDFLELVKFKLGLKNLNVIQGRIEDLAEHHGMYDRVTARALKPLPELLALSEPFINDQGALIFLKGESYREELEEAKEVIEELQLILDSEEEHREISGRNFSAVLTFKKSR